MSDVFFAAKVTCSVPDSEPLEDPEKLANKVDNNFLASADTHVGCVQTNGAHDSEPGVFVRLRFDFLMVCDFWCKLWDIMFNARFLG